MGIFQPAMLVYQRVNTFLIGTFFWTALSMELDAFFQRELVVVHIHSSGQIIATSHDLTLKGS